MVDPRIPHTGPKMLDGTRELAHQWSGQLSQLFGWLLVINFGLVSIGLGLVVTSWPATPEFLASATGAWLLLLAGCRGFSIPTQPQTTTGPGFNWAKPVTAIEAAFCVGTGFVLLQADWPSRPAAVPTALTFAAAVVAACALLDAALARFGTRTDARQHLIRAGGWLVAAITLMALLSISAPAALAAAAVLVGAVEIVQGGWLLSRSTNGLTDPADESRTGPREEPFIGIWTEPTTASRTLRWERLAGNGGLRR